MRSSIILPIALAAASVAPAIAMPTAPTGSEAINWHEVGTVAKDAAGVALDVAPFFFRRELEDALLARAATSRFVDWTTIPRPYGPARGPKSGPIAFRRELEHALMGRAQPAASEAINWGTVAKDGLKIAGTVAPLFFRRELEDALMARAVESESDAINWGTVAKDGLKVAGTVAPLFFRRELEDAILARALELPEFAPGDFDVDLTRRPSTHRPYRRSIFDDLD